MGPLIRRPGHQEGPHPPMTNTECMLIEVLEQACNLEGIRSNFSRVALWRACSTVGVRSRSTGINWWQHRCPSHGERRELGGDVRPRLAPGGLARTSEQHVRNRGGLAPSHRSPGA